MGLSAISVDLDSLVHYCRIQGLDEAVLDDRARRLVWDVAVPRYLELLTEVGLPATFFVIGAEADPSLARAHAAGVELASHSWAHDYRMSRWDVADIAADLRAAHEAIAGLCGVAPVGFRAPGYTLSPALLAAVASLGYRYDSSACPATPYYLVKAGVMGALKALGRPSGALLDTPRVLLAPTRPYRPSLTAPYTRGAAPLVELPISVARVARVPFIGTFAVLAPWPLVLGALASLRRAELLNFELHAIDVLDLSDGIPAALARQQRDALVSAAEKRRRLAQLFRRLKDGFECVTLREAAGRVDLDS